MSGPISGPGAAALHSLTPAQVAFLQSLPKAELHAHLNGCIPLPVLQALAREYHPDPDPNPDSTPDAPSPAPDAAAVHAGLQRLQDGVVFPSIHAFFSLFPSIYALTAAPAPLARAARAVLQSFLDGPAPQCTYLELRTTPRASRHMTRAAYLRTVLAEVERYPAERAALLVSIDRRMSEDVVAECMSLAIALKREGRRIVGVDLCGDPLAGDIGMLAKYFREAKKHGLGVTLHIAEVENRTDDTLQLLALHPDRLGHATFLDEEARQTLVRSKDPVCIELCLSSNLLCKTVASLRDHHIMRLFENKHPIAICTDDTLPFRNSLLGEYALLMAQPPLGLGLDEPQIASIAAMGMRAAFI